MKKKRTTVGERIMCKNEGVSVQDLRTLGVCPRSRGLASIIDSALKRAVREGYDAGWEDGGGTNKSNDGWNRLAQKYGMRGVE